MLNKLKYSTKFQSHAGSIEAVEGALPQQPRRIGFQSHAGSIEASVLRGSVTDDGMGFQSHAGSIEAPGS